VPERQAVWVASGLIALWVLATAIPLRGDASYDLANYHLYGPFALLHGKFLRDLGAAQSQGYLPPLGDVPYYLLSRHLPDVRLVNGVTSLPAVVAGWLMLRITLHLLPAPPGLWRTILATLAVLFGLTGAATRPVLATSMSDMIPVSFIAAGLLVLLRDPVAPAKRASVLLAGLLVGAGVALKMTLAYAAAGTALGLLAWSGVRLPRRLGAILLFGGAAALSAMLIDGWWWLRLWRWSGNPMFPLYNQIFRSPLAPVGDFLDRRFFPHGWREALLYPVLWALDPTPRVTEVDQPMRDPRIACAALAALALLLLACWRPALRGRVRAVAVLFLSGLVLWEKQFSIFRYLSLLELLSGPLLAVLAAYLVPAPRAAPLRAAGAAIALLAAGSVTILPHWGRGPAGSDRALDIAIPALDRQALVLLLDAAPMAFLATAEDPAVRFMGVDNNLTQPWVPTAMQARIRAAIGSQLRDRAADLWGLEWPDGRFGRADDVLAAYRLSRATCLPVRANIVHEPIRLCRLVGQR